MDGGYESADAAPRAPAMPDPPNLDVLRKAMTALGAVGEIVTIPVSDDGPSQRYNAVQQDLANARAAVEEAKAREASKAELKSLSEAAEAAQRVANMVREQDEAEVRRRAQAANNTDRQRKGMPSIWDEPGTYPGAG